MIHFFVIGSVLFAAQSWLTEDPRIIVVTSGVRADLGRRFEDAQGRPPDARELAEEVRKWARDEALYREAVELGLDRDDAAVRSVLVDKMAALAAVEVPEVTPTEAELDAWLAAEEKRYATPVKYEFEFLTVSASDPDATREIERMERALQAGQSPSHLGRSLRGAHLSEQEMNGRLPVELRNAILQLPVGPWQRVVGEVDTWLVRVKKQSGGSPKKEAIRPLLVADWAAHHKKQEIDRILDLTAVRYRIDEVR